MKPLPPTDNSIVVRTDFSDDERWLEVCRMAAAPVDDFQALLSFVSDDAYAGAGERELEACARAGPTRSFMFFVDRETLEDDEHPIGVMDLGDEPGRTFRVVPNEMWGVENNLSLANLDFRDFADATAADGVFRGFPTE